MSQLYIITVACLKPTPCYQHPYFLVNHMGGNSWDVSMPKLYLSCDNFKTCCHSVVDFDQLWRLMNGIIGLLFEKEKVSSVKVKHFFVSQPHDEFIWNELHKVPFLKGSDCTFFQIFSIPFQEFGQNFRDNFLKWNISLERLNGTFQNLVRSFS